MIALGVVGPPEACIVTGYKDNGERLLCWSLYQTGGSFGEYLKFDESGYFIKDNWWENTEAIMSVGEEVGAPVSVKTILENALTLMTQERIEAYEGTCGVQFGGQAAYEAWAEKVEDDTSFADGADLFAAVVSHEDQECMLSEGRSVAASYLRSLAEQYPALENDFTECAGLLKSASECVCKMQEARGGQGAAKTKEKFCERAVRLEIAANIREAAAFEKSACSILERIIKKL